MSCGTHLNFEVNFTKHVFGLFESHILGRISRRRGIVLALLNSFESKLEFFQECDFSQNRIAPFAIGENFTAPIQSAQKLTKHDDVKIVYKLTFNLKVYLVLVHDEDPLDMLLNTVKCLLFF
jgi:hypothetical protein